MKIHKDISVVLTITNKLSNTKISIVDIIDTLPSNAEVIIVEGSGAAENAALIESLCVENSDLITIINLRKIEDQKILLAQGVARSTTAHHAHINPNTLADICEIEATLANPIRTELRKIFSNKNKNPDGINEPVISVVIPCFNSAMYLERCLSSICAQDLPALEILAVNDGSSDASKQILEQFMQADNRIKVIHCNKPSGHPGTPRNIAILAATGRYIGFVDSDDWVDSQMFSSLCSHIADGYDIISATGFYREEEDASVVVKFKYVEMGDGNVPHAEFFKNGYFSNVWTRIYRRNFLNDHGIYFPPIYISEDFCFSVICHGLARHTKAVEAYNYHYRYDRPDSTTDVRKGEKGFSIIDSFESELNLFRSYNIFEKYAKEIIHKKLNSFWYTYERLHPELKGRFLARMRTLFSKYKNSIDTTLYSQDELGKLKLLRLDYYCDNETQKSANEKNSLGSRKMNPCISQLQEANILMRAGNIPVAINLYKNLAADFESALWNLAYLSLKAGDISKLRLYLHQLDGKKVAQPLKERLITLLAKPNSDIVNMVPSAPLVSIIIPVHNSAPYLEKCIKSVLTQTYRNLEVIIINDGSTDGSKSIIDRFARIDGRIKFIHNESASGNPGTPRNLGISAATGFYTAFVDSDDWISVDYIEKLVNSATPEVDIVFASGYVNCVDEKTSRVTYKNSHFNDASHLLYRYHESFTIWDKLYKTSFLKENKVYLGETKAAVDLLFIFKAYYYCNKAAFCDDNIGYFYRRESQSSVTLNKRRNSDCDFEFQAYSDVQAWLECGSIPQWYRDIVGVKKVNSYLYTLTIIGSAFREKFRVKARAQLCELDQELITAFLTALGRHENRGRYLQMIKN